jgi:hypothetical protein
MERFFYGIKHKCHPQRAKLTVMRSSFFYLVIAATLGFLSGCKSYYIPVQSFKQQLGGFDSTQLITVRTQGPMGEVVAYKTYPLKTITCVDNKGRQVALPVSPSLELRVTSTRGKRSIFYFDQVRVNDTSLMGAQSRFMPFIRKTIPFSSIKLIEIQDGKKRFRYVD